MTNMTPDQLDLLSDMIANKLFAMIEPLIKNKGYTVAFEPMPAEEFLHKDVDAFGNMKMSQKDILAAQMSKLLITKEKLLSEEKYELLQELEEIYAKLKEEYNKL
tara:strand:- start:3539 stop:3853 length:315 start_codon:yes stop_codon:yes gene_type:complete